jgi:hypothetical protein
MKKPRKWSLYEKQASLHFPFAQTARTYYKIQIRVREYFLLWTHISFHLNEERSQNAPSSFVCWNCVSPVNLFQSALLTSAVFSEYLPILRAFCLSPSLPHKHTYTQRTHNVVSFIRFLSTVFLLNPHRNSNNNNNNNNNSNNKYCFHIPRK